MASSRSSSSRRTSSTRTSTSSNTSVRSSSAAQQSNSKPSTISRNVVVVNPATGQKTLQRNQQTTVNRGQVYVNGRMVANYGVGQTAADKAKAFGVQIASSPYQKGQKSLTVNMKKESAYQPSGRTLPNGRLLQTGTSKQTQQGASQGATTQPVLNRPVTVAASRRNTVTRDTAAEDSARQAIAAERGIDVNTASAATLSLLDEAAKTRVYGTGLPKFAATEPEPTEQVQTETPEVPTTPPEPVTPEEIPSIVTSDYAKTYRGEELQNLTELLGVTFDTVQNGLNDLISSDVDILSAQAGGEDAQALLEQRRAFYEDQYNSLKSEISRIYTEKAADYKIEAAQQMGSTISQLAAMGALGTTTAGIQYVNDVSRLNSAKMLSFAAEEAAAIESAFAAFQEADFKVAQEMIDNAKATREEIRKVKQEELANQKTMIEIRKLEREDAAQTIDAMVSSGLDINELPPGYIEYLDAKGGYAPGTSKGLWEVAQKERALKEEQDAQAIYTTTLENSKRVLDIMQNIPIGQTVNIDGVDYTGLSREGFQTGSEDDGTDTTVWAVDPISGEIYTKVLEGVSSKDNWEWHETNGVGYWVNNKTQRTVVGYNTNMPLNGMADPNGSLSALEAAFPDGVEGPEGMNPGYKGECAAFVNHVTGLGLGNTWEEKMSKMDASIGFGEGQTLPQPGDVFVMPITANANGHTGFVTSVQPLEDGTYDIGVMDSNWVKTKDANGNPIGAISHHTINSSRMTGFARPGFKPEYTSRPSELQDALTIGEDGKTEVEQLADAIIGGTLSLSDIETSDGKRASVALQLDKQRRALLDSGDFEGYLRSTAGQKDVSDTFIQSMDKAVTVLGQVSELQTSLSGEFTDPILGIVRSNNPYDVKAQEIQTQLKAIVPNLARGIYGEVGVLTDADIANYSQTLPNIRQPEQLRNAVLGITIRTIQRSIESKLKTQAASGRDVSGYIDLYNSLKQQADNLLAQAESTQSINISEEDSNWFNNIFR